MNDSSAPAVHADSDNWLENECIMWFVVNPFAEYRFVSANQSDLDEERVELGVSLREHSERIINENNLVGITSDRMHVTIFEFAITFSVIFLISSTSKSTMSLSILWISPKRNYCNLLFLSLSNESGTTGGRRRFSHFICVALFGVFIPQCAQMCKSKDSKGTKKCESDLTECTLLLMLWYAKCGGIMKNGTRQNCLSTSQRDQGIVFIKFAHSDWSWLGCRMLSLWHLCDV